MTERATIPKSKRFVAFLRGINVGGSKPLKMDLVRRIFEDLNYTNVKSVLASGNILFSADKGDSAKSIAKRLSEHFETEFGFTVPVIIRTLDALSALVKSMPFEKSSLKPDSKLHVTFFSRPQLQRLKTPYSVADGLATVTQHTKDHLCAIVNPRPGRGTPDWMKYLEDNIGPEITTRTWGTIEKILKAG